MVSIHEENCNSRGCPECLGQVIYDERRGQEACNLCGLILSEKMPNEEQVFLKNSDKRKKPSPFLSISLHLKNHINSSDLNGIISTDLKRAFKSVYIFDRMEKIRNLQKAKYFLLHLVSRLEITIQARDMAFLLYKKAEKKRLTVGRSIEHLVIACLWYSCKFLYLPYGIADFINLLSDKKEEQKTLSRKIYLCYLSIIKELNLRIIITKPKQFIQRYCNELGFDFSFQSKIYELIEKIPNFLLAGKDHKSILAGLFYFVNKNKDLKKTQEEISKVFLISELTIRERVKELKAYFKLK